MKRFAFWIFLGVVALAILAFSCSPDEEIRLDKEKSGNCGKLATVRDLTDEGACGFVFELEDGTRLVAYWEWGWCGTPPLPEGATKDPLYNFQYVDGKKVTIAYEEMIESMSSCWNGKLVKVTCLQELGTQPAY